MAIELEVRFDLGAGEATLTYDGNKAPIGISLRLISQSGNVVIEKIESEKFADFINHCHQLLRVINYEEAIDEPYEDEDDEIDFDGGDD